MSEICERQFIWAILESCSIDLQDDAIEFITDTDSYYEMRKRIDEVIKLGDSNFKKIGNRTWLIKEVSDE